MSVILLIIPFKVKVRDRIAWTDGANEGNGLEAGRVEGVVSQPEPNVRGLK